MRNDATPGLSPAGNPWVQPAARPSAPEQLEPDPVWDNKLALVGPARPGLVPDVDVTGERAWPTQPVSLPAPLFVMGLHGGAGATTLSGLLGAAVVDLGTRWPEFVGWERPAPELSVVVCARTHHVGLSAAARFARLWAANTLPPARLLGLVVIDDGPRLSAEQKSVAKKVGQMTPHGWHLAWNEAWRTSPANPREVSARTRKIVLTIQGLAKAASRPSPKGK